MSQGTQEIALSELFKTVNSKNNSVQQGLLQRVQVELDVLAGLSKADRPDSILKNLKLFVKLVNERNLNMAQQTCQTTEGLFNSYLRGHLEDHYAQQAKGLPKEPQPDYDQGQQDVNKDASIENQGVGTGQRGQPEQKTVIHVESKHKQPEDLNTEYKAGQKAMHAMKTNSDKNTTATNASTQRDGSGGFYTCQEKEKGDGRSNTADNRPEVLAKKFKTLYDEIWPEAHDYLLIKIKIGDRKKVVETLLKVVQNANKFCKKEAEEQISSMALECLNIVRGKPGARKEEISKINLTLIKEFRQANAKLAIPRLQTEFWEEATKSYFLGKTSAETSESLKDFCNRAVELLWWMNMHEPPVYVCPTSSVSDYVSGAYEGCGKKIRPGDKPSYFVWPAVRERENGAVIEKGLVEIM